MNQEKQNIIIKFIREKIFKEAKGGKQKAAKQAKLTVNQKQR